jgi:hypothetical protein
MLSNQQDKSNMLLLVNCFRNCQMEKKVFVEGVNGSIPGSSIFFQDQEDRFIKKDGNMHVQHVTVEEFKKKLHDLYLSTESPSQ